MHGDWRGGQPPKDWNEANYNSLMNMYDRMDAARRAETQRDRSTVSTIGSTPSCAGSGVLKSLVTLVVVILALAFVSVAVDHLREALQGFADQGHAPNLIRALVELPNWGLVLVALAAVPVSLLLLRLVWGLVKMAASLAVFFGLLYVGYLVVTGAI